MSLKVTNIHVLNNDLTSDFNKNFQKFNGSYYEYRNLKITVCRAKSLPKRPLLTQLGYNMKDCPTVSKDLPVYPYVTMDMNWSGDEGMTMLIEGYGKKVIYNYVYPGFVSAEDPRIYKKASDEICIYFMAPVNCDPNRCSGIWETKIMFSTIESIFKVMETQKMYFFDVTNNSNWNRQILSHPVQICKYIDNGVKKSIFDDMPGNVKIYKNFSPIENMNKFMDGINGNIDVYNVISNNSEICTKGKLTGSFNLKDFVQPDWSNTLTTPTILYSNRYIGVTHIRIKWKLISNNYYKLNPLLQKIILKNDVHHKDFYFMSVYNIKQKSEDEWEWKFTKPFIITGDVSEDYFSYNICFPCGVKSNSDDIKNMNITIHYGNGDCLLVKSDLSIPKTSFYNRKFDYNDLEVYTFTDEIILKDNIYPILKCNMLKYILPSKMLMFDLGGSGLKLVEYNFHTQYSKIINLGRFDHYPPNMYEMLEKVNIDIDDYTNEGGELLFSLADITKLWTTNTYDSFDLDTKNIINSSNIETILNIPNHVNVTTLSDMNAHTYGNISTLGPMIGKHKHSFVLHIAIGSGINTRLLRNSVGQPGYMRQVQTKKYVWDYKYNGKRIRQSLIDSYKNDTQFLDVIGTILTKGYNIDKFVSLNIIISGGLTHALVGNQTNIYTKTLNEKTMLFINPDLLNPYKGLVEMLKIEKGIIDNIILE